MIHAQLSELINQFWSALMMRPQVVVQSKEQLASLTRTGSNKVVETLVGPQLTSATEKEFKSRTSRVANHNSSAASTITRALPEASAQNPIFATLLMRHQMQREKRTHAKVGKPVKPEVADALEPDTHYAESSIRLDIDPGSFATIAAEKMHSPTVSTNKHFKTMSSLQSGETPRIQSCVKPVANGQQVAPVGRNTMSGVTMRSLADNQRLLQRQMGNRLDSGASHTSGANTNQTMFKTVKAAKALQENGTASVGSGHKQMPANSNRASTFMASPGGTHSLMTAGQSAKTKDPSTSAFLLASSNRQSKRNLTSKSNAQGSMLYSSSTQAKESFSIEPPVNRGSQMLLVEQHVPPQDEQPIKAASKTMLKGNPATSLHSKKRTHTSADIQSQLLNNSSKSIKSQQQPTFGRQQHALGGHKHIKNSTIKLEGSPQSHIINLQSARASADLLPKQTSHFLQQNNSAKYTAISAQGRTSAGTSKYSTTHEPATFTIAAFAAVRDEQVDTPIPGKLKLPARKSAFELTQNLVLSQESVIGAKGKGKAIRKTSFNMAAADEEVSAKVQANQIKASQQASKLQSLLMRKDEADSQVRQSHDPKSLFKKAARESQNVEVLHHETTAARSPHKSNATSKAVKMEKRTTSAVNLSQKGSHVSEPHQDTPKPTNEQRQNTRSTSSHLPQLAQSRNEKQSSQAQLNLTGRPTVFTSNTMAALDQQAQHTTAYSTTNAGNQSSREGTLGAALLKKEIKCVITKQTKFDEERQQLQGGETKRETFKRSPPASHENDKVFETTRSQVLAKTDKKAAPNQQNKLNSRSHKSTSNLNQSHTHTGNTMATGKASNPLHTPQIITIGITKKSEKTKMQVHKNQSAVKTMTPGSADKYRDKLHRKQIVQKIKNQLIQAFDSQCDGTRFRHDYHHSALPKSKSSAVSDSGFRATSSQLSSKQMLKTYDEKVSSPVLKSPSMFVSTPTREANPHRPKQAHQHSSTIFKNQTGATRAQQHQALRNQRQLTSMKKVLSDHKKLNRQSAKQSRPDHSQVIEVSRLDIVPAETAPNKTSQQRSQRHHRVQNLHQSVSIGSNFESQLSAPQEISSASLQSCGSPQEEREPSKGVIIPQSVSKLTKQKLAKLEKAMVSQGMPKASLSRNQLNNSGEQGVRFSQRYQRTLPNLIVPDEHIFSTSLSNKGTTTYNKEAVQFQTVGHYPKDRRNTVFSDTHSLDLVRASKPTFNKPSVKNTNTHSLSNERHEENKTGKAALQDSPVQPEVQDESRHIPPIGLSEQLQLKAMKCDSQKSVPRKVSTAEVSMSARAYLGPSQPQRTYIVSDQEVRSDDSKVFSFVKRENSLKPARPGPMHQPADLLSKQMNYQSHKAYQTNQPIETARTHQSHGHHYNLPTSLHFISTQPPTQLRDHLPLETHPSNKESFATNDAFSDSQFGDIADEENYIGGGVLDGPAVPERDLADLMGVADQNLVPEDTVIVTGNMGRLAANTLSGKYTSCTNKNDTLLTGGPKVENGKRLATQRPGNQSSIDAGIITGIGAHLGGETAKEILSKKGSKCKCKPVEEASSFYGEKRAICSNYCKHLSSRQQKKVIKKLLLEHFKTTVENVLGSNQKLALSQVQNPFLLQANFGLLGDRKFLVSASWWAKWCDYVNFTADEHGNPVPPKESFRDELLGDVNEEGDLEKRSYGAVETADLEYEEQQDQIDKMLRLSIFKQSSFATLAEAIENDNEESQLFYERPSRIENEGLLEEEVTYGTRVKSTVVERFDYEVVPHSVWQHLYSWYSADVTICRRLAVDTSRGHSSAHQENPFQRSSSGPQWGNQSQHQDSFRQVPKFGVFLDLWPTNQTIYDFGATKDGPQSSLQSDIDPRLLLQTANPHAEFEQGDDPTSFESTQLLYKKHIEMAGEGNSSTFASNSKCNDDVSQSYYMKAAPHTKKPQGGALKDRRNEARKSETRRTIGDSQTTENANYDNAQANLRSRQRHLLENVCRNTQGPTDHFKAASSHVVLTQESSYASAAVSIAPPLMGPPSKRLNQQKKLAPR